MAKLDEQDRQDTPLLQQPEPSRRAVSGELDRAEQAEFHASSVVRVASVSRKCQAGDNQVRPSLLLAVSRRCVDKLERTSSCPEATFFAVDSHPKRPARSWTWP